MKLLSFITLILFIQCTSSFGQTVGYLPKYTGTNTFGNSLLYDNGTTLLIGATMSSYGSSALPAKIELAAGAGKENIRINNFDGANWRYQKPLSYDYPAISFHAYKDDNLQNATSEISFLDRPGTSGFSSSVRTSDIYLKTAHSLNGNTYAQYLDNTMVLRATQDGGYVGIGVTIPVNKLDVSGSMSIGSSYAGTNLSPANGLLVQGAVVIGTTDFSKVGAYALAVNGSAIFTKAIVKLNANWADYVFNDDYELPSLKNLEAFIKVNKHLPGVASAAQVKKEGIDIGNNQTVFLQKIEELSLYAISQDKEIRELKEQVNKLITALAELKVQSKK